MKTSNPVQHGFEEQVSEDAMEMSIDVNSTTVLMDALGKLYSRPAQAVLREYLSNAVDAHVAKGGELPPIEIKLPLGERESIIIRDYGNGISEEGFDKVLRHYGASTKRDSNNQIGGFGLGAKAGFALGDEFFITSYQNGLRLKARVFKTKGTGKGFLEIVEREATSEPDGVLVEVHVPIGNREEVSAETLMNNNFFSAYRENEITVEGATSSSYRASRLPYNFNVAATSVHNPENYHAIEYGGDVIGWVSKASRRSNPVRANIGRVAYTLEYDVARRYGSNDTYSEAFGPAMRKLASLRRDVVLNLPIGSVDMPSAREHVIYSERSVKTISALADTVSRLVDDIFRAEINACDNGYDALIKALQLKEDDYEGVKELMWRGKSFPLNDGVGWAADIQTGMVVVRRSQISRGGLTMESVIHRNTNTFLSLNKQANWQRRALHITDRADYSAVCSKVKNYITDYTKALGMTDHFEVTVHIPGDDMSQWSYNGEQITLDEIVSVVRKYRAEKRALAKAARPANLPASIASENRQVMSLRLNVDMDSSPYSSVTTGLTSESELGNAEKTYYLSKAEVKDDYSELSVIFPTRSADGSGVIPSDAKRPLRSLIEVLGEDATVLFIPATRNMDNFKREFPGIRSVVDVLKEAIEAEWDAVQNKGKTETFLSDPMLRCSNRHSLSLVHNFVDCLSNVEQLALNADIVELAKYGRKDNYANSMTVFVGSICGSDFVTEVSEWMARKVQKVADRYPLMAMMTPNYSVSWDDVKYEMIRYLKTC